MGLHFVVVAVIVGEAGEEAGLDRCILWVALWRKLVFKVIMTN